MLDMSLRNRVTDYFLLESERRDRIYEILSQATSCNERLLQNEIPIFSITSYGLSNFSGSWIDTEMEREKETTIWKWMETLRTTGDSMSAFLLPPNAAGPDLVFTLEREASSSDACPSPKRVLCAVQVRPRTYNDEIR
jgi:hypothetical protein